MLHEPKFALLCAMTINIDSIHIITEPHTIFTDQCKGLPTREKYEAINAAMHCFIRGYKKVKGFDSLKKYSNEYQPSVVANSIRVLIHWMNQNEINFVISDFKKGTSYI
jgi:hypothetical protein